MQGICRLHGDKKVVTLLDSHIIPRWMYKRLLHSAPPGSREMVRLQEDIAIVSGEQLSEHILCVSCEARFSVWEKYVAAKVARQANDRFPGLDAIEPSRDSADKSQRAIDASALDIDKIVSFAASVFWRASVSSVVPDFSLGGKYDEQLRRFLRGESRFPQDLRLFFQLLLRDEDLPVDHVMTVPRIMRGNGHDVHMFAGCGMLMGLVGGSDFPSMYDDFCLVRSKAMVVGLASPMWRDFILSTVKNPDPRGKLAGR
jgi:hypothetical protein